MRMPRLSIAKLMIVVMTIAINCGIYRQVTSTRSFQDFIEAVGVFLMSNILLVGLYRLTFYRGERKPFLLGFEVSGLVAMLAFVAWNRLLPKQASQLIEPILMKAVMFIMENLINPVVAALIVGLPMLLIALIGGLLALVIAKPQKAASAVDPAVMSTESDSQSPRVIPFSVM